MVEYVFSLGGALRCRFTISPLAEVVLLARAMAKPEAHLQGVYQPWLREHAAQRRRLEQEHDLRPLLALLSAQMVFPGVFPQLPEDGHPDFEAEMAHVRVGCKNSVRLQIRRFRGSGHGARTARGGDHLIASAIGAYI
jgi:hypothetical protein